MIFAMYNPHKATNENVLTLSLHVNSCSPEGVTKLSTFYALWQFYLLIIFFTLKQCINY